MAKSLVGVCQRLQTLAQGLGYNSPPFPKESTTLLPLSVAYPQEGNIDSETLPATKELHTVVLELHRKNTTLDLVLPTAIPEINTMSKAILADPTLNGTCDTIVGPIRYKFGKLGWGGQMDVHIGTQFLITVKIRTT